MRHKNTCWCKTQDNPEIYKHDKKKYPNHIHFTCSKCNAHVIIHKKMLDGITIIRNNITEHISQTTFTCGHCGVCD